MNWYLLTFFHVPDTIGNNYYIDIACVQNQIYVSKTIYIHNIMSYVFYNISKNDL